MSKIIFAGNQLIQSVGEHSEILGLVSPEENPDGFPYVLWLLDTRGVFGFPEEDRKRPKYVRGDTFTSMQEARGKATSCASAQLFHYMWLIGLQNHSKPKNKAKAWKAWVKQLVDLIRISGQVGEALEPILQGSLSKMAPQMQKANIRKD